MRRALWLLMLLAAPALADGTVVVRRVVAASAANLISESFDASVGIGHICYTGDATYRCCDNVGTRELSTGNTLVYNQTGVSGMTSNSLRASWAGVAANTDCNTNYTFTANRFWVRFYFRVNSEALVDQQRQNIVAMYPASGLNLKLRLRKDVTTLGLRLSTTGVDIGDFNPVVGTTYRVEIEVNYVSGASELELRVDGSTIGTRRTGLGTGELNAALHQANFGAAFESGTTPGAVTVDIDTIGISDIGWIGP